MTAVPDARDECGACGHDRDDHRPACIFTGWCDCPAFEEPA